MGRNLVYYSTRSLSKRVLFYSLFLGLMGTVSNIVFISPLPSLVSFLLIPLLFFKQKLIIPRFVLNFYYYTIYSIIGVLLYLPQSFLQFGFYRYDGNFFISYAPLIVAPLLCFDFDIESLLQRYVRFATLVNGVSFILLLLKVKASIFTIWLDPALYYHSFFKSTNAAGGYLSLLITLNVVIWLKYRKKSMLVFAILNFFFLLLTFSRGSLLGLFLGFFFYFMYKKKMLWVVFIILSIILTVQVVILYFTYPIYVNYLYDLELSTLDANTYINPLFGDVGTKSANILIRAVETWPRAIDNFLNSPIIGAGYGAVNDTPFTYSHLLPFIALNNQPNYIFNDAHAHHSYFHILGEQGIIGLFLFMAFWVSLFRYIAKSQDSVTRTALLISFFNLSIMSFTEHRITSPSNALPFVIIVALFLAKNNSQLKAFE